jgi:opacity protein-like surface antigen
MIMKTFCIAILFAACLAALVSATSYKIPASDLGLYCSPTSAGGNGKINILHLE